jgi:hypothetical protein
MMARNGAGERVARSGRQGAPRLRNWRLILTALCAFAAGLGGVRAQEHIGSTVVSHNDVTRDLAGAMGPLAVGDSVYRNEGVRTGADSTAKLVFLDSTNLGVGPVSHVTLDQFVYVGESNGQKMAVNLAKGVFRFTTGALDKKAYTISTPTAAIGVRGTVLDIRVQGPLTRVTLVEGQALVCPRRPGITFEQQAHNCARAAGGVGGPRCECIDLTNAGQTAQVKKAGGANQASLSATPVNFASVCAGDSSLCSGSSYAYANQSGGFASGVLCGR